MEPPVARVGPVRDTHFGVTIDDPYRWMEDESPEFQSWVDGQAAYARELLDALPGREALLSRIRQLRGTTTQRFGFVHANGRAFLFRGRTAAWIGSCLLLTAGM